MYGHYSFDRIEDNKREARMCFCIGPEKCQNPFCPQVQRLKEKKDYNPLIIILK